MREFYDFKHDKSNNGIAHRWYYDENYIHGGAQGSNFYYAGPFIYSYGPHFICGYKIPGGNRDRHPEIVLITQEKNSVTTQKHLSYVRGAVDSRSSAVFYSPVLTEIICMAFTSMAYADAQTLHGMFPSHICDGISARAAKDKLWWVPVVEEHFVHPRVEELKKIIDKLVHCGLNVSRTKSGKRRNPTPPPTPTLLKLYSAYTTRESGLRDHLAQLNRHIDHAYEEHNAIYSDRIPAPAVCAEYNQRVSAFLADLYGQDWASVMAAALDSAALSGGLAGIPETPESFVRKHAKSLVEWREYKRNGVYCSNRIQSPLNENAYLRYRDGLCETSKGLKVTVGPEIRALAEHVDGSGKLSEDAHSRIFGQPGRFEIEGFTLHEITPEHWIVGCHKIPLADVAALAETLNAENNKETKDA